MLRFQQEMLRFFLVALTIVAGLSALGIIFVSQKVVSPIEKLHKGAIQIGKGTFNYNLEIKTGDEIEELSLAFNQMSQDLYESINKITEDRNIISAEKNKLEVVMSGITDMVVATDQENRIITFNRVAEELLGVSQPDVLGKPVASVMTFYDQEKPVDLALYCQTKNRPQEGMVFKQQNLKMIAGQREKFVNLTISQIQKGEEVNLGCIFTIRDITISPSQISNVHGR